MKKTQVSLRSARLSKSALKLGKICLIAFAALSCAQAPPFPKDVKVYQPFPEFQGNNVVEHKIVDAKKMQIRDTKIRHPIQKIRGMYCFDYRDQPRINAWIEDMTEFVEKECKR